MELASDHAARGNAGELLHPAAGLLVALPGSLTRGLVRRRRSRERQGNRA